MSENVAVNPLGTEPIGKLLFKFALPSAIALIVNSVYSLVDQLFIGNTVGYIGNAATNVILAITLFTIAVFQMLADGTVTNISLNLGRKQAEKASRFTGNSILFAVIVGIIILVVFEVILTPFCIFFGATETSLPYCLDYGSICVIGLPFLGLATVLSGIVRAYGKPIWAATGLIAGCVINIFLDWLFMYPLGMDIKGAAIATVIGEVVNAIITIVFVLKLKGVIRFNPGDFKPGVKLFFYTLKFGLSSFIHQLSSVAIVFTYNNLLVQFGALSVYGEDIPLAAFGVCCKVNQVIMAVCLGVASGAQPIHGYNYGAGNFDRVKNTLRLSMIVGIIFMAIANVIFVFTPELVVNMFGVESELYLTFAVKSFRIFLGAIVLSAPIIIICSFFQGIGKPGRSAVLSLTRQLIICIPAAVIMANIIGVEGVLFAGPTGDIISTVMCVLTLAISWKGLFKKENVTA